MKVEQITPMEHYTLLDEFISHEGFCRFIYEFFGYYNSGINMDLIKQLAGVKNDKDTEERSILVELTTGELYVVKFTESEWSNFQKSKRDDKEKD